MALYSITFKNRNNGKNILRSVKSCIGIELNTSKKISLIQKEVAFKKSIVLKKNLFHLKSHKLSMRQHYLYQIVMTSRYGQSGHQSHFFYNHFAEESLAWETDLDIQPVFNHYKQLCMFVYISRN